MLTTSVFKYFKLTAASPRTETILAMANGDPLLVESPVHRGRVLLVATSAEPTWSALPLWPSFVPLVQEIVAHCVRGQSMRRNVTVGDPLEASIAATAAAASAAVRLPDGRSHAVALHAAGDYSVMSYTDTWQSGIYRVRCGDSTEDEEVFSVNVETAESDLAQLDLEELQSDVWPDIPFVHQTSWQDLDATVPPKPIGAARLHVAVLYAVLALLLIETWTGWRRAAKK